MSSFSYVLLSGFVKSALDLWLNQHVDYGKKLAELVIKQAQARTRAGQKIEKRKSSGVAVLPGKLTDCESEDIIINEYSGRGRFCWRLCKNGAEQRVPSDTSLCVEKF
jgi:DNA gyrase/topoisomerase IV subunit B